jgi:acyl-CoA thioester hydrolase
MQARKAGELLAGFPVVTRIPVAWAEMDVFRHVNNTVYFRWFEIARVAYFERVGFYGNEVLEGIGPILHSTRCRFRSPVAYPDLIHAGTRISDVAVDRFIMAYRIVSESQAAIVADGSAIVVTYDYAAGTKAPLPDDLRERIEELEGGVAAGD